MTKATVSDEAIRGAVEWIDRINPIQKATQQLVTPLARPSLKKAFATAVTYGVIAGLRLAGVKKEDEDSYIGKINEHLLKEEQQPREEKA